MRIDFRAAQVADFAYCRRLYFGKREDVTADQESSFRERWEVSEVRIITCGGTDVGWLQSRIHDDSLFLVQLFLEPDCQGKGIGTEILNRLMGDASQSGMPMTLGVVKTNPARRLYERLGFKITHEDDRKFYMRYEP
jgi:GNAT superfamily N-acetyltransferase